MRRTKDQPTGVTLIHGTCHRQQNDKWVSDWRGNAALSARALGVFNPPPPNKQFIKRGRLEGDKGREVEK